MAKNPQTMPMAIGLKRAGSLRSIKKEGGYGGPPGKAGKM